MDKGTRGKGTMKGKTDDAAKKPGKARVYVTLKPGVLDPQGQAVAGALLRLGFGEVADVRIGKFIEISLCGADAGNERERLAKMCEGLLANPVIEDFRIEYEE